MAPATALYGGPPHVTEDDPPHETSGMAEIRLDMQGNLLFLRGVPPQVDAGDTNPQPDWDLLFAEAGLDKARFTSSKPKWTPPDAFDSRADWEGTLADHPDLPLHVSAAAFHGRPVYFQVIAPWDKPWRSGAPSRAGVSTDLSVVLSTVLQVGVVVLGALFARWNLRRGRGDSKGALRLVLFSLILNCIFALSTYHYVPRPDYVFVQFILLAIPLLFALLVGIGYIAVEPFARRLWPELMVSWQRLLSGRLRDPLVGRDILFGVLAGAVVTAGLLGANAAVGISEANSVGSNFGQGALASLGISWWRLSQACLNAMIGLGVLTVATGILRRKWLGILIAGLILIALNASPNLVDIALTVVFVSMVMLVLVRLGLIASACFTVVFLTLLASPPLDFSQWYAGRAMIALLTPIALLLYGFYISLGNQPIFGKALDD